MTEMRLDVDLSHPLARVWRAITEQRLRDEWYLRSDVETREGASGRMFVPPDLSGYPESFGIEVVEVTEPYRLVQRWHGDNWFSQVTWELTETPTGTRLSIQHTGFTGTQGPERRRELRRRYHQLFYENLPAVLDRLAAGAVVLGEAPIDLRVGEPVRRRTVPIEDEPTEPGNRRVRLLSIAGLALLVVLCASAAGVWYGMRGPTLPEDRDSELGLGQGAQPGQSLWVSGSAVPGSATPSPGSSTAPGASATPESKSLLTASYKTIAVLGLGGFDTEVTVRNPGTTAAPTWTVVLTMPSDKAVENKSPTVVKMVQQGDKVTLTPVAGAPALPKSGSVTFTIRFPAVLALGKSITACSVDGKPCTAG